MEWKEIWKAHTKKAQMSMSKVKAMVIGFFGFFFFNCQGIILQEWVPDRQTINAAHYIEVLKN